MDDSDEQFNTLIAELVARMTRAVSTGATPPPLGLGLTQNGEVRVLVGACELPEELAPVAESIRAELSELAKAQAIVASCVSWYQSDEKCIIAELENNESYCAQAFIPIVGGDKPRLDIEEMTIEDGSVYIFAESAS